MPSDVPGFRGRAAINNWRVKAGRREVFSNAKKNVCAQWMREHDGKLAGVKLRLVPPNKQGHKGH